MGTGPNASKKQIIARVKLGVPQQSVLSPCHNKSLTFQKWFTKSWERREKKKFPVPHHFTFQRRSRVKIQGTFSYYLRVTEKTFNYYLRVTEKIFGERPESSVHSKCQSQRCVKFAVRSSHRLSLGKEFHMTSYATSLLSFLSIYSIQLSRSVPTRRGWTSLPRFGSWILEGVIECVNDGVSGFRANVFHGSVLPVQSGGGPTGVKYGHDLPQASWPTTKIDDFSFQGSLYLSVHIALHQTKKISLSFG